jgi:hypothetical protein
MHIIQLCNVMFHVTKLLSSLFLRYLVSLMLLWDPPTRRFYFERPSSLRTFSARQPMALFEANMTRTCCLANQHGALGHARLADDIKDGHLEQAGKAQKQLYK